MKKKRHIILYLLFGFTALILFAPMAQQNLDLFSFKQLTGYEKPTEKPLLSSESYQSGAYQKQMEEYLQDYFGFREPLIRLYNQCTYDLFRTTSNNDVAIEKDGWLYHTESIGQYFGTMEDLFGLNNQQVKEELLIHTRTLAKVNAILKEYGVHLLTFSLPTKTFVYPQHLSWHPAGDTTFNAATFFQKELEAKNVPHINMAPWFKQMQDTTGFDLFYSKGSHWAAGASIAVDSILRYMELIGGKPLAKLQFGAPYSSTVIPSDDKDLENLLNLMRPLKHEPIYEYPVNIVTDDNTFYPKVWFVGTSFYWYMKRRVSFEALFKSRDFSFYEVLFYSDKEKVSSPLGDIDHLRELLLHDYVVFFRDGPQLYHKGVLFPGNSLISLCISEERLEEKTDEVADSLIREWGAQSHQDSIKYRWQALVKLQQNPELFEELRGDAVPSCRNPRINDVLAERALHEDRTWSFLLWAKARNDSTDAKKLFEKDTYNMLHHKPLLRDHAFFTSTDYFDFIVEEAAAEKCRHNVVFANENELVDIVCAELKTRLCNHEFDNDTLMRAALMMDAIVNRLESENLLQSIRAKAKERHVSIDKMFRDDAVWCYNTLEKKPVSIDSAALVKAFEFYTIENKIKRYPPSLESIHKKRLEHDLPFRVAMNRDIRWIYENQ